MKHILFLFLLIPFGVHAQEDSKYLADAVPVEDGKVVFTKDFELPFLSQDQVYDALLDWANGRFADESNRVVYADREKGQIAVSGKQYLIFSQSALSLDRSLMSYQVIIQCHDNGCVMKISSLRYEYAVQDRREPERYVAEKWITDEYALHKNKLTRGAGKFRKATINFVDDTYESAIAALGSRIIADNRSVSETVSLKNKIEPLDATEVAEEEKIVVVAPVMPVKDGYVLLDADNVPETLLKMLPSSVLKITVGEERLVENPEWKGIGNMFGKIVATVLTAENSLLGKAEVNSSYTLLFYKGEKDDQAWLIMDCVKQGEMQEGNQKTIIGEVLRVMIK